MAICVKTTIEKEFSVVSWEGDQLYCAELISGLANGTFIIVPTNFNNYVLAYATDPTSVIAHLGITNIKSAINFG